MYVFVFLRLVWSTWFCLYFSANNILRKLTHGKNVTRFKSFFCIVVVDKKHIFRPFVSNFLCGYNTLKYKYTSINKLLKLMINKFSFKNNIKNGILTISTRLIPARVNFHPDQVPLDQIPPESIHTRSIANRFIPLQVIRHFWYDIFFCTSSFSYGFHFCTKHYYWTSICFAWRHFWTSCHFCTV